ncbi:hypothetical protein Tco_0773201 [Tanacetum coccineum]|uniref:Uncharacterized protein n=1 Tax=Tanacetum coccineum TaxID=301880 RepID=A0ABQ4ZNJ8_9ASTR
MNSIDDDQGIGDLHLVLFEFTPEKDANKNYDFKQTDDAFPFTQFYGTPSAYVAYSEEVELEWPNKEKWIRSDNVNISQFTPYNICDAKPLQSIPPKAELRRTKRIVRPAEVLRSPYVVREVSVCGAVSNNEKRAADCLFSGRFNETNILFKTDNVNGLKGVLETLCPGIKISSGVINIFTKVLKHAELYHDPLKPIRRHDWDVKKWSAKGHDVKESSDIFNASMRSILRTTAYRNLHNMDLEVHILDNMQSLITDVSERYGDVVHYLDDLCGLRRECKAQKLQLDELRIKYAAKILLSDINQKKSDYDVEVEAYSRFPLEERQRLEEGAFEKVKARVTRML